MFVPRKSSECLGSPRIVRLLSIFTVALALLAVEAIHARPADAQFQYIVINNGLAPPNPANVIDGSDPTSLTLIRNVGCPPADTVDYGACPLPGAATEVEIVAGANLEFGGSLIDSPEHENAIRDSSVVTMTGGFVRAMSSRESARFTLSAGTVFYLKAYDDSVLTLSGGDVILFLQVWGNARVRITGGTVSDAGSGIYTNSTVPVTVSGGTFPSSLNGGTGFYIIQGNGFEIDGVPAAYGDYPAYAGRLTGTWESGEAFSFEVGVPFTLAPPAQAVPALPMWPALALAATLVATGTAEIRRRRAALPSA